MTARYSNEGGEYPGSASKAGYGSVAIREEALSIANLDLNGILNMPPGPELDALVAKEVMGYNVQSEESHSNGGKARRVWFIATGNGRKARSTIPHYSTDLEATWEVATNMQSRGDTLSLEHQNVIDGVPGSAMWTARSHESNELGMAGTPSLAICRAALLAIWNSRRALSAAITRS